MSEAGQDLRDLAASLTGRRVLITGGLGFIGSNLARVLVDGGASVTLVDALVEGHGGLRFNIDGIEEKVEVCEGDVRESRLMRDAVRGRDLIFSLAGQTSHLDSMVDPELDLEHNCRGPLAVLEACRTHAPEAMIVFAGTRQIYGRPVYLPVDETHRIHPVDVNGIHKWAGEAYHTLYGEAHKLRVSALRLTNTYGPRMRVRDARQTFLGLWIRRVLSGEPLELFGGGSQRRDFTYIDDALRAFLLVATNPRAEGRVFNLGDVQAPSLREVADLLISVNEGGDVHPVEFPLDREAIEIGDYQGDFTRIRETLGWEPDVSLADGLRLTLDFFSAHHRHYW